MGRIPRAHGSHCYLLGGLLLLQYHAPCCLTSAFWNHLNASLIPMSQAPQSNEGGLFPIPHSHNPFFVFHGLAPLTPQPSLDCNIHTQNDDLSVYWSLPFMEHKLVGSPSGKSCKPSAWHQTMAVTAAGRSPIAHLLPSGPSAGEPARASPRPARRLLPPQRSCWFAGG